jgi:exopolysaccharide production protein ExoY
MSDVIQRAIGDHHAFGGVYRAEPAAVIHQKRPPCARPAKRFLDVVGSLSLLAIFAPVFLVIAVVVRLDGGPVLFRQWRIGASGRRFVCLKFRTMVPDAEARLGGYLASDPAARADWKRFHKLHKDARVTRVGAVLRRSSLDELPQLVNVLRGQMSLVGPRPIVDDEVSRYAERLHDYLRCRPGMTGLWQVSRREAADYARRTELDSLYAGHWSFRRDILILARTIPTVIRARGAY